MQTDSRLSAKMAVVYAAQVSEWAKGNNTPNPTQTQQASSSSTGETQRLHVGLSPAQKPLLLGSSLLHSGVHPTYGSGYLGQREGKRGPVLEAQDQRWKPRGWSN